MPDYYASRSNPPVDVGDRVHRSRSWMDDSPGLLSGGLTDVAPYWETRGHRVHKVASAMIVWDGPRATWNRPRVHVDLRCKSLPPTRTDMYEQLRLTIPAGSWLCDKCFWKP